MAPNCWAIPRARLETLKSKRVLALRLSSLNRHGLSARVALREEALLVWWRLSVGVRSALLSIAR